MVRLECLPCGWGPICQIGGHLCGTAGVGGALVQPMVTTRGSATSGTSLGEVGSNTAKGRIKSRESQSLYGICLMGRIWLRGLDHIFDWQMQVLAIV